MQRILLSPPLRATFLLLAIVAAYVVPRAVALNGVRQAYWHHFEDMRNHLTNLDSLHQLGQLSADHLRHPFFDKYSDLLLFNPTGWPPLVYQLTNLWYGQLEPQSIWIVLLTNGLFTLVLLVGLAGLGHAMGSLRAGLWAGLLAVLCPPLAGATMFYNLDYPLTAVVTVGLWLLCRTRDFTRLHACLALGAWSGVGLAIKSAYPLFLIVPSVWLWVRGLRRPGERWRVLGSSLAAVVLALGAAFALRDMALADIADTLHRIGFSTQVGLPAVIEAWTLDWLVALPKFLLSCYPAPLVLAALPGLLLLHRTARARLRPDVRAALLGTWWGSLLMLQVLANKLERYQHPVYPLLCLVTAWWCATRVPRRWRTAALAGAALAYASVLVTVPSIRRPGSPPAARPLRSRSATTCAPPGMRP